MVTFCSFCVAKIIDGTLNKSFNLRFLLFFEYLMLYEGSE